MTSNYWIRAARRRDRDGLLDGIKLPPVLAVIDAHRRLRGPYTAAGTLVRSIAGDALARCPELGPAHNIEILTSAPELAHLVPPMWTSLEWTVQGSERTRFYSRLHTLNISNGLAELLRDYLRALGCGPRTLVVENVHEADPTDQEFVAVLLRRSDLGELTVVVGTGVEPVDDPPGTIAVSLAQTLSTHAQLVDGSSTSGTHDGGLEGDAVTLARAYVASDGTSDDPRLLAGYEGLSLADRTRLHDERLTTLAAMGQLSLRLGAVPYHAERGSDPSRAGLAALDEAMQHCRDRGLYHAAVDFGLRGRAIVDRSTQKELWWHFIDATSMSLATIGRAHEAEALHNEARAASRDPGIQMTLAYGTAMLYARHYPEDQRNYQQARAWMNVAGVIASMWEDPKERAFRSVFSANGLALVEVRQKNSDEALRLLEDGMARLEQDLDPGEHALHRTVLRYNRALALAMMGRLEEALADYVAVVDADPDFPEHHFNVGNILRRMGRNEEAIAAYERALQKSPPFPEAYYNRGDARLELGDLPGALSDFDYAIELDPGRVDAHVNRAALLWELGDVAAASQSVTAGLALSPDDSHLLCLKARLLAEVGQIDEAWRAASAALDANRQLGDAWAIRGELAYQAGDLAGAARDFDRAVELTDGPTIRFNRAVVHENAGRYIEAVTDYQAVLATSADVDAAERLTSCLERIRQGDDVRVAG